MQQNCEYSGILLTKITEIAFGEKGIVGIDFACEYCMVAMFRNVSNTKQYIDENKNKQKK